MIKKFIVTAAIAASFGGVAAAQSDTETETETTEEVAAPAPSADTVLATVNGTDITLGHVIALTSRLPDQYKALPDEQLMSGVLEQLIQQTALTSGMSRDKKSVALAIENEVRALLATEKLKSIEDGAITDEGLQAAYDAAYADQPAEQEWKSQHILLENEEDAKAVVAEIEGGADFGEVAKAKSTGPSGPSGGDLGWQGKGRLVPEFENAMIALEPGAVSAPVKTQFGWHVIKLNEVREKPKPTLDDVRGELEGGLKEAAVRDALTEAVETAEVVRPEAAVDPSAIRNLDLLKD
ncbi:MAG: peptidylprolyl isomerase [Pseudomonadota bacterium]